MTDKKDPIQLAAEEYQRALEESISKKKEELIEEKKAQAAAEQEAQELSEAEQKLQEIQAKRAIIRRLRELKEAELRGEDIQEISESIEEESQEELVEVRTAMDNYVDAIKSHEQKKVQEDANLLGGGEGGEVSRAEFQALKTSLASLGGGGLGEKDVIDLIAIHAPTGSGGSDSGGLDSAQILNLLGINQGDTLVTNSSDSSVIWNILNVDSGDTFITNTNLYTTLGIDSGSQIITNSGGDSNSIWTILNVDSGDTFLTIENLDSFQYGDSDVIDLLNDSGVQNILPQLDSTYDLGDSARRWRDLWLSGNTIHLGDVDLSSVGDSGAGVYANGRRLAYLYETDSSATGGLDSAEVIRLIDSALDSTGASGYTTADHDSDTLAQVDSAYVQARVTFPVDSVGLDSAAVAALIDSALDSFGTHYTTADHDSDTLAQVDSAYVAARLPDLYGTPDHDSDTLVQVDSAYVRARVKTDQDLQTTDDVSFGVVTATLDGAIEFVGRNTSGGPITKGQAVYINGISGNTPTIALADANNAGTMPAFGLAAENIADTADGAIYTFGTLKGIDTSAYLVGDTLYISETPGALTATPPAGVNNKIQNIGRVMRSHASVGSIKIGGAGRSNAVPNLSSGQIFYGNDSDRAVPTLATDVFDSAYINSLVDDPYLHELQDVQIDSTTLDADEFLQWNGSVWTHRPLTIETSLQFKGSIDVTTDVAPTGVSGALYVNTGTGVALGSYTGVAGDSFQSGQTIAWSDSDNRWYQMGVSTSGSILEVRAGSGIAVDDSDAERPLVSINRTTTDEWYLDSTEAIVLIDGRIPVIVDSAYVNLRADHYTTANHDSDTLALVDSGYINARADDTYVNVTGDTMTGDLVIDSGAHLTVENGGNVRVFDNGSVVSNNLNSVGNSNLQLHRNSIRKFFIGGDTTIADQKIRYNSGYNRDSYTSDLVGEDSYTLMPKWYIDSATSGDYVQVAGDSMTGKLFAPAIQITQNPDDSNRSVLTFAGTDSDHSVEVIEGTVDYDLWVTSRIQDNVTWKVNAIAYSDTADIWVALGDGNWTSTDAETWTTLGGDPSSPALGGGWTELIWDGSQFVAVKPGKSAISSDGLTWTEGSGPSQYGTYYQLDYDGTTYIAPNYKQGGVVKSTDGLSWTSQSTGIGSSFWYGVAYGNSTWVIVGKTTDGTGAVRYSTDGGSTWNSADATNGSSWRKLAFGNGRFVAIANYSVGGDTNWIMHSADGITWTSSNVADADQSAWQDIAYVDGKFIVVGEGGEHKGLVSEDGINWTRFRHGANQDHYAIAYGQDKIISAGYRNEFSELYHVKGDPGIYFDGDLVATKRNLQPLIDRVNELSGTAEEGVFTMDSDPTSFDSVEDSTFVGTFSSVRNGRFWYNTATSTLSIRDSDTWKAIGGGSTLNNTDSLPEGDSNLYYTTARHDSDTLVQVDSAYVQARQSSASGVTVDSVEPSPASDGDLWYDPTTSLLSIRDSGEWDTIGGGDSGFLPLTGGTVTGELNLDSGGIQLGPEGGSRTKLYTGIASFESSWSTQASTGLIVVSGQGFTQSARNPSTGRIVAKANVSPLDMAYSDDDGATWTKLSSANLPHNTISGGLFSLSWDSASNRFWAVINNPKDSAGDLATVIQWSRDGIDWKSVDYGTDTWIRRYSSGLNRSDELVLRGQTTHTVGENWISWGYDDSGNVIGFAGDASEYIGGITDANDRGVQGEGLVRTVPGTVTDSSGGTWIVFGRTGQGGGGKINGGDHSIFPKNWIGDNRTKVGGPMVYSKRHQQWIKVWGNGRDNFQPDTRYGKDPDGSMDWMVAKSSDGGKTWTDEGSPGYDYNDIQQVGDARGYFNFNAVQVATYSEENDVIFMSGRWTGSIYSADWGETWNRIGFNSLTSDNQKSSIDATYGMYLRGNVGIVYNEDEGYYYAVGRVGGKDIERGFVSYDLKNWRVVPEELSTEGNDGRINVLEWIGGNDFWRAGVNAEPQVPDEGEIGTFGEVERDLGVLKFGRETVLTDSNFVEYVTAPYIETKLPSKYEMSGVSSLVILPDDDVNVFGTIAKSNGKFDGASYAKNVEEEGLLNTPTVQKGEYRITFAENRRTDANYAVTATIESETDWTLSARTVTIYDKTTNGFVLLVERTDTGTNTEVDARSISVIIHE